MKERGNISLKKVRREVKSTTRRVGGIDGVRLESKDSVQCSQRIPCTALSRVLQRAQLWTWVFFVTSRVHTAGVLSSLDGRVGLPEDVDSLHGMRES